MILSPKQSDAMRDAQRWLKSSEQTLYLAGYAGSGKSTLARMLVEEDGLSRWMFAAFTGKASHVLREKGCPNVSTIHALIYRPAGESNRTELKLVEARLYQLSTTSPMTDDVRREMIRLEKARTELIENRRHRFSIWEGSPLAQTHVRGVVIDECSMVDERMAMDLMSFGKKILILGDPFQLPPVGKPGYFTSRRPDIMLDEVHRQAQESGVLRLANFIRNGGNVRNFESTHDCRVVDRRSIDRIALYRSVGQVLCGRNETRKSINLRMREDRASRFPERGDKLVCLRNDRSLGLYNGSQWMVRESITDEGCMTSTMTVQSEDDPTLAQTLESWSHHFVGREKELNGDDIEKRDFCEFDYGYAMTVHKSQGSQWKSVALCDESDTFGGAIGQRWLYTGITRASEDLSVIR